MNTNKLIFDFLGEKGINRKLGVFSFIGFLSVMIIHILCLKYYGHSIYYIFGIIFSAIGSIIPIIRTTLAALTQFTKTNLLFWRTNIFIIEFAIFLSASLFLTASIIVVGLILVILAVFIGLVLYNIEMKYEKKIWDMNLFASDTEEQNV